MSPNQQTYAGQTGIEIRSVEQSIQAATESMGRAEYLLEQLHASVTGYEPPPAGIPGAGVAGLVRDADDLASRLEAFCADLERTSARITAGNVQSLAHPNNTQNKYAVY